MKHYKRWAIGIAFLAAAVYVLSPYYEFHNRPKYESFKIGIISTQTAQLANFQKITAHSVVVEGPCQGGCYGGVMKDLAVDENSVDEDTKVRGIWLYQIEPITVRRRNDAWGQDDLTIIGTQKTDRKIYFVMVPARLVRRPLSRVFVETRKENRHATGRQALRRR